MKKFMKDGNVLFEGLLITSELIGFYLLIVTICNYLSNRGY